MQPRPAIPFLAFALALLAMAVLDRPAAAIDLRERTVSSSKQFTIYCTDVAVRSRVASFAEELKGQWLQLMGDGDHWKYPIVVTLDRAASDRPEAAPVELSMIQHEASFNVQIAVRIGADPAQVNLQKHLLRAMFLEFAYRERPDLLGDKMPYHEAPWWLVEGALQSFRTRESGVETDLFKRLLEGNRVPSLTAFLAPRVEGASSPTLEAVDQACAMCLVQLLLDQPNGRDNLRALVRHLPEGSPDPVYALQRDFPALAEETGGAQKWWTLNLARLSAGDRFKGLSPEETDAELAALLQFDVPAGKGAEMKSFGIGDFEQYLKLPASKEILIQKQAAVLALSSRANALYRGIVGDYEQIFGLLARNKTHGLKERLGRVALYRESLLRRKADIADYLNWFEATKMNPAKGTSEGYIRAANELATPVPRKDPISRYLDEISQEF